MADESVAAEAVEQARLELERRHAILANPGRELGFMTHNDVPATAMGFKERGSVGGCMAPAFGGSLFMFKRFLGEPLPCESADEPKEWLVTFDPEGVVRVSEWWLEDPDMTMPSDSERKCDFSHTWFATAENEAALHRFEEALATFVKFCGR